MDGEFTGATGVLLSIAGGESPVAPRRRGVAEIVRETAAPDANIIFGTTVDPALGNQIWVTVIATGFEAPHHDDSPSDDPEDAPGAASPVTDDVDDLPSFDFGSLRQPTVDLDVPDFLR